MGTDKIKCARCGKCCLADMAAIAASIEEEDVRRWRAENRRDILHVIETEHAVWAGDHLVSSTDGSYIHGCHFLKKTEEIYTCSIYETRPVVCRTFTPGSSSLCTLSKK
jgi:Fe-S-cluster containining protein